MVKIVFMGYQVSKIIKDMVYDFPVSSRPYRIIANKLGISEDELLEILNYMRKEGVIRRIAAILYHRKAFYTHNAMVVWQVSEQHIEKIGLIMASFPEVSHCYERDSGGFWKYNLYTMVHGKSLEACEKVVKRMAEKTGIKNYKVLFSKREFKKTSLTFNDE